MTRTLTDGNGPRTSKKANPDHGGAQLGEYPETCAKIKPVPQPHALVPTVFHNPWWLEAASAGRYEEVYVASGGRILARLPFVIERGVAGSRVCTMPELTHFLGPALDASDGSLATQTLNRFELTTELIARLGATDSFYQAMHRSVPDTLSFTSAGFRSEAFFNFEIRPGPLSAIWHGMRDKTRNVIRRAWERYTVAEWNDPGGFAAFYEANLRSRGVRNLYSRIAPVCEAAFGRRQGCVLSARGVSGAVHGAICLVWDQQSVYFLLSTRSSETDNSVMSLLVWHGIVLASEAGLIFDFDGIGPPGNRLFYTGFGGEIVPRYSVSRHSLLVRAFGAASRALRRS